MVLASSLLRLRKNTMFLKKVPQLSQSSLEKGNFPVTSDSRDNVQYYPSSPSPLNINFAKPQCSFVLVLLEIIFQCFLFRLRVPCCLSFACVVARAVGTDMGLACFEFIRAMVPEFCLLCPCSCCACLVNPHISLTLQHVAFITFVHVFSMYFTLIG